MVFFEYFLWLKKEWAKVGLILSIYLFMMLFVFVRKYDFVVFILLLQTPLYMLHQTEEYIFPGGFGKFFNTKIFNLVTEDKPLDENFIFYVNVLLIWIALPVFGLLSTLNYSFGLWLPYFSLFAGVAHIALALKAKKLYNPGLLMSLFINIPVGLWSILYLMEQGLIVSFFLNIYFVIGLAINLILPIMGTILFRKHQNNTS
ncbi:MAG TPA: HXXEE domain-containing protein [Chloroflexi bacterium]|nr:HXXEE domain-containing protein [Chloroflexota bacterium]